MPRSLMMGSAKAGLAILFVGSLVFQEYLLARPMNADSVERLLWGQLEVPNDDVGLAVSVSTTMPTADVA